VLASEQMCGSLLKHKKKWERISSRMKPRDLSKRECPTFLNLLLSSQYLESSILKFLGEKFLRFYNYERMTLLPSGCLKIR
jgi:hypothetical protein